MDVTDSAYRVKRLPTVAGYFALVWSHIGLIVLTTLLGGAVGVALERRLPRIYEATTSIELPYVATWVNLDPIDDLTPKGTTIDSTARLVFSRPVIDSVVAATRLSKSEVTAGLGIAAYPLSRVLIIKFEAPTSAAAVKGADTAAQTLIKQREQVLLGSRLGSASQLVKRLVRLANLAEIRVGPFNPVSRRLREQAAEISQVIQSTSDQPRVVNDAFPAHLQNLHGELQIVSGALLGMLTGIAIAWWLPGRRLPRTALSFGTAQLASGLPPARDRVSAYSHDHKNTLHIRDQKRDTL